MRKYIPLLLEELGMACWLFCMTVQGSSRFTVDMAADAAMIFGILIFLSRMFHTLTMIAGVLFEREILMEVAAFVTEWLAMYTGMTILMVTCRQPVSRGLQLALAAVAALAFLAIDRFLYKKFFRRKYDLNTTGEAGRDRGPGEK